jgi:glycosyltransferase involved in cell wall biosynthesis
MNRISACVITLNEEQNLPRLLASLRDIVDEVVIVDSGSVDRTEEIARSHGAVFHFRQWTDYASQKNHAATLAASSWVLSLDADEELSSRLQSAILGWKKREPQFDAYEMARRAWYLGKWINHSGWYPDFKTRLYRKGSTQFAGSLHETLDLQGPRGRLDGDLLHYTIHNFSEHQANVEKYSTLAAEQMYRAGKRRWRAALWFATPWSFFQNFVLRAGFLDGYRGALIAQMAARTVRLKYRKLGKLVAERGASAGTPR